MFPQEPPVSGNTSAGGASAGNDGTSLDNEGMYYIDFGPFFAEEVQKVLRYRMPGMYCELMFWQDEYRF